MTVAGTIGFSFPRVMLGSVGEWLANEFEYVSPIICAPDDDAVKERAARIGRELLAQSQRSRKEMGGYINVRLRRDDAQWIIDTARPRSLSDNRRAVFTFLRIVTGVLRRRRGRRSLSTAALQERSGRARKVDERHRWRCRARIRRRAQFARNYASARSLLG